jgi:predicted transcriptional regulator
MKIRTICLPDPLDRQVDEAARRDDRSRSSFVRRALELAIASSQPPGRPQQTHSDARNAPR